MNQNLSHQNLSQLITLAKTGDLHALQVLHDYLLEQGSTAAAALDFLKALLTGLPPHRVYDTVRFDLFDDQRWNEPLRAPNRLARGTELELFRDLQKKLNNATNLRSPRRIGPGEQFRIERVRVDSIGLEGPSALREATELRLRINRFALLEVPLRVMLDVGMQGLPVMNYDGKPGFDVRDNDDLQGQIRVLADVEHDKPTKVTVYLEGLLRVPLG